MKLKDFEGNRAEAVKEAKELTELSGRKVYVEPKGATFTCTGQTDSNSSRKSIR